MKRGIIAVVVSILASLAIHSQEFEILTFDDSFSSKSVDEYIINSLPSKEDRVNSTGGVIQPMFDSSVPDTIRTAISVACDLWQSKLNINGPIVIEFKMEELSDDVDVRTDVINYISQDNTKMIPASLYVQSKSAEDLMRESVCATIEYNNLKMWNCGFSETTNETSVNATFATLRALCHAFGFGSSAKKKATGRGDIITFSHNKHTVFDGLIFSSDGKRLTDVPIGTSARNNAQLAAFAQPSDSASIYVVNNHDENRMYAPSEFEANKSLQYLDNPQSLMHYDNTCGDLFLDVDSKTLEIMEQIGWTKQVQPIKSLSHNIC